MNKDSPIMSATKIVAH